MSIYFCNVLKGTIAEQAKPKLAASIAKIASEATGETSSKVRVFFFEDAPRVPFEGLSVFALGTLITMRDAAMMGTLEEQIRSAIQKYTRLASEQIAVSTSQIPREWVMENSREHANRSLLSDHDVAPEIRVVSN